HPQASTLHALAQWIGEHTGATVGFLTADANSLGAQPAGAQPRQGGLHPAQLLAAPGLKAVLPLHAEPGSDAANPSAARAAVSAAQMVVSLSAFKAPGALEYADVLLPISPFSETSGTFVNAEGRVQSFHGVVKPLGETRPAWKVLRVLGNLLSLPRFEYETSDEVRAAALGDVALLAERLSNHTDAAIKLQGAPEGGLERIADVPIYSADALVRRAPSLQQTADAAAPVVGLPQAVWAELGLSEGAQVKVSQGDAALVLPAVLDDSLPANVVHVPSGHPVVSTLGHQFGAISVVKV